MNEPHIHRVGDGRGVRRVFVDDVEVKDVVYANTLEGVVEFHVKPLRLAEDGKSLVTNSIRGRVQVLCVGPTQ